MNNSKYLIQGGYPVKGKVVISGNKNAALPCLAATLLSDETIILKNIPDIKDIHVMIEILQKLGSQVTKLGPHEYKFQTLNIKETTIDKDLALKIRASILFAGPLLARCNEAHIYPPGGDVIGRRRLDTHVNGLMSLGVNFHVNSTLSFTCNTLKANEVFLEETSVTATENLIMATCLAEGTSIIENAACEPHVQDLCHLLNNMGASIKGIGTNVLTIKGVKKLHGAEYKIGPDFMEIGSMIGLTACTKGELEIQNVIPQQLKMIRHIFKKFEITWDYDDHNLFVNGKKDRAILKDLGNMIPKIEDAPWPAFPADLMSIIIIVATQSTGTVLLHEKLFESRLFFVDKLLGMGANIVLCDPHRIVVTGKTPLQGENLTSPDVRAGMALLIAALTAEGQSCISNVYQIERGYENITDRLTKIGAQIAAIE